MSESSGCEVAVIGAGIIGLSVAWALRREGRQVILLDPTGISEMTSKGNASAIAVSDILPLASPGILRKAPRWFFDPLGPLSIPITYLPRLLPWLWRFWLASFPARFKASIAAQAALMALSDKAWQELIGEMELESEVRQNGALYLYESEREFRYNLSSWALRDEFSISYDHVESGELRALEPTLSPRFTRATRVPQWFYFSDPYIVSQKIADNLMANGVAFRQEKVLSIAPGESSNELRLEDGASIQTKWVVIASGAWSNELTRPLGDNLPLETERGYNTTIPNPGIEISHELIFSNHGFVATQLDTGLRIGGADELAGLKRAPNFARSKAMVTTAKAFLPGLKSEGGVEWMGHRPSFPDSLPVISPASGHPQILYAFGHGHLGLTQAAATGQIIAAILADRAQPIDLSPFSATRF